MYYIIFFQAPNKQILGRESTKSLLSISMDTSPYPIWSMGRLYIYLLIFQTHQPSIHGSGNIRKKILPWESVMGTWNPKQPE